MPTAGETVRIACLHTADSNIAVFNAAADRVSDSTLELMHTVRTDLLAAAEQAGGLTDEIAASTRSALLALCSDVDAVLLTCSTLGPAVDHALAESAAVPIMRTDAALAERAIGRGGKIVVLCAVSTTLEPTAHVFEQAQAEAQARANPAAPTTKVEVQLVAGAWDHFKAHDTAGYLSAIAAAANQAYANGADVVALAQASMSGASALVDDGHRILNSPDAGLEAVGHAVHRANTRAA